MIQSTHKATIKFVALLLTTGLVSLFAMRVSGASVELLPEPIRLTPQLTVSPTAACTIKNHSDTAVSFFRFFVAGDRISVFANPAVCVSPQYPFEVQSVSMTLYGGFGANWPVEVAIELWSAAIGDSCGGPITLIHSDTFSLDLATYGIPNVGTASFATPVCVTGPFFVAVLYTGGTPAPYPSVNFDNHMPGDTCINWAFASGQSWTKWNQFWSSPYPGSSLIWVDGQTQSSYCSPIVCCVGTTGNVNTIGIVDLADLSAVVSYLTGGGYSLPCYAEANVNGSGIVDLGDLSALVSYLTGGGYVLPNCT
jgi:hypothetical protein